MIHDLPCTICRRFLERKLLIRLVHDKFRRLMATWHVKITFDRESMSAPDGGESLERSVFWGNIDMWFNADVIAAMPLNDLCRECSWRSTLPNLFNLFCVLYERACSWVFFSKQQPLRLIPLQNMHEELKNSARNLRNFGSLPCFCSGKVAFLSAWSISPRLSCRGWERIFFVIPYMRQNDPSQ